MRKKETGKIKKNKLLCTLKNSSSLFMYIFYNFHVYFNTRDFVGVKYIFDSRVYKRHGNGKVPLDDSVIYLESATRIIAPAINSFINHI